MPSLRHRRRRYRGKNPGCAIPGCRKHPSRFVELFHNWNPLRSLLQPQRTSPRAEETFLPAERSQAQVTSLRSATAVGRGGLWGEKDGERGGMRWEVGDRGRPNACTPFPRPPACSCCPAGEIMFMDAGQMNAGRIRSAVPQWPLTSGRVRTWEGPSPHATVIPTPTGPTSALLQPRGPQAPSSRLRPPPRGPSVGSRQGNARTPTRGTARPTSTLG